MQNKNKALAISIAFILVISMATTIVLIPNASAHSPKWEIPTYAYINAGPSPIGVGQTAHVYMWLDAVYGAAGGTTAVIPTNGSTASAGLLSNNYRFQNYKLTITAPDGTVTTQTFAVISDTTSNQYTKFVPTQIGTYKFDFSFPGQVYGVNGNGYEKSVLIGDSYLPSNASTTLVVQEDQLSDPINSYPLPTAYWTHPIYGENTDWWSISSDYLGSAAPVPAGTTSSTLFHGDAVGPLTSHVMWTRQLQFGGVVGGNNFVSGGSNPEGTVLGPAYWEGSSYRPRFTNGIVIDGILFYKGVISTGGSTSGPTTAVDLRTGKVLWSRDDVPLLSFGYIYNIWNPDQHGVMAPILFTSNFARAFDAYTGDQLFNVTNMPSGTSTTVAGPSGEQIKYFFQNAGTNAAPQWYLAQWNSSRLWIQDVNPFTGGGSLNAPSVLNWTTAVNGVPVVGPLPSSSVQTTVPAATTTTDTIIVNGNIPLNATTTGQTGVYAIPITTYDWNISVPWLNTMPLQPTFNSVTGNWTNPAAGTNPVSIVAANFGDAMLCRNGSLPTGYKGTSVGQPQLPYTMFLVNLNASKGAVGSILWMKNYDPPAGNITMAFSAVDWQTRVFTFNYEESLNWVGYDLNNGEKLWTTPSQEAFDYYGVGNTMIAQLAYGNMYTSGFSGVCYCFNDRTGQLLWTYGNGGAGNSTNAGLQVFYGVYPTFIQSIAGGVIYLATNEHTIPDPLYKGCTFRAVNATDGTEIWQLSGYPSEWSSPGSDWYTADGYLVTMNGLDNNIYSIGRGSSALTVSAPDVGAASGQTVVIRGTVLDTSAGTKQDQQSADFPYGVPCSSDASMKDWMGYVYQQKPLPSNFIGVDVTINVVDSNGNFRSIGTAKTDYTGAYSLVWTPDISGTYNVIASFAGTNGYWPSSATTAFNVMQEHPTATPAPTAAPSMADQYFVPAIAGLFVFIAIIGVVIILVLRKRP